MGMMNMMHAIGPQLLYIEIVPDVHDGKAYLALSMMEPQVPHTKH